MEPRFADLSSLSASWNAQLDRWGIKVIESLGKEIDLNDRAQVGGRYLPDLQVIEFFEPWSLEQLAHELVHVMQEVHGRLTDMVFSREIYYSLLDLGYEPDMLEFEAEAYACQQQPEMVLRMLEVLPLTSASGYQI